ncbi:hypothetical protein NXS19_013397, partial [Fusarium pseudograminearum]
ISLFTDKKARDRICSSGCRTLYQLYNSLPWLCGCNDPLTGMKIDSPDLILVAESYSESNTRAYNNERQQAIH